jgi:hypothetical protein
MAIYLPASAEEQELSLDAITADKSPDFVPGVLYIH